MTEKTIITVEKKSDVCAKETTVVIVEPKQLADPKSVLKVTFWQKCRRKRTIVSAMLFLGMANAYIMRTNMSVAIVAMVDHKAVAKMGTSEIIEYVNECNNTDYLPVEDIPKAGQFAWDSKLQGFILSAFFYGYVITQIPFAVFAEKYGSRNFLGFGMLLNSLFGLLVPIATTWGYDWLVAVRFVQGLGEGPIVPCTHALLARWIPPNERSRMGAFVYAGAQFGTIVSMPLSGFLSEYGFSGGWPSIFYIFGCIGAVWSVIFLFVVYENPDCDPKISQEEKEYIARSLGRTVKGGNTTAGSEKKPEKIPVPYKSICTSLPLLAILVAHVGQNYGYETLMTELPTFMKQILHFDIAVNGAVSALPYLAMWLMSFVFAHFADKLISNKRFSITTTRKILNSIGQFGPAIALVAASFTGCNRILTVALLTIGVGLNGAIYSGFKVNHLDLSPQFAGVMMALTNCMANLAGLLAPITAGHIIAGHPSQAKWMTVFMISATVYVVCGIFYIAFGSGNRQAWDVVEEKEEVPVVVEVTQKTELEVSVKETQH